MAVLEREPTKGEKRMSTYRSSASFGKRQEYMAVAELLRRGYDVYMTLVDDQQIDCIVRQEKDGRLRYLDIQIKARSKDARNPATFAAMEIRKPRKFFYCIFYSEAANTYWVIPSLELVAQAYQNKSGVNKGKYRIVLANRVKEGVRPRPKYRKYESAFDMLAWNE